VAFLVDKVAGGGGGDWIFSDYFGRDIKVMTCIEASNILGTGRCYSNVCRNTKLMSLFVYKRVAHQLQQIRKLICYSFEHEEQHKWC